MKKEKRKQAGYLPAQGRRGEERTKEIELKIPACSGMTTLLGLDKKIHDLNHLFSALSHYRGKKK